MSFSLIKIQFNIASPFDDTTYVTSLFLSCLISYCAYKFFNRTKIYKLNVSLEMILENT